MHPVLESKNRLGAYLLAWTPLAALIVLLMRASSGLSWPQAIELTVPMALIYAFVCLSNWYLCRSVPPERGRLWLLLFTQAGAAVTVSAIWMFAGQVIAAAFEIDKLYLASQTLWFTLGILLFMLASAFNYALLALENSRQAEARVAEARVLAREAELKALKTQLNPHFLFNCLHSISSLAGTDPGRARQMCVLLSDVLRSSLGLSERGEVPLSDELALARRFLAIEQVRFGERLGVEEDIEEPSKACMVPSLLLQPLVENAVKHGIATLVEGGAIKLRACVSDAKLTISIENPFDPEGPSGRKNGLGLVNVRKRLEARDGEAARLDAQSGEGRYRVDVELPAKTEASS